MSNLDYFTEEPAHGTWSMDCQTHAVTWSQGMHYIHHTDADSFVPTLASMGTWYPGLSQILFAWAMKPDRAEAQRFSCETELCRDDGTTVLVLVNASARLQHGLLDRIEGVVYDLDIIESQRVNSIAAERRYQTLFRDAPHGLIMASPEKKIVLANPAICKLLGYTAEELLGLTTEEITHPDDRETAADIVRRLWEREVDHFSYEKRYVRKDGSIVWIHLGLSLFRDAHGTPISFIGQCQDISDRKRKEILLQQEIASKEQIRAALESQNNQLRDLVSRDPLTQLWNRTAFEAALRNALEEPSTASGCAVVSVDIGSLALRNRNHGEKAVDELLRSVATALCRACSGSLCIARISGGCFRVLLQSCDEGLVGALLNRVKSEIATVRWRNGPLSPTVGTVLYNGDSSPRPNDAEDSPTAEQVGAMTTMLTPLPPTHYIDLGNRCIPFL